MNSPISSHMDFTTVEVDSVTYGITLPYASTDYIQGIIRETLQPYEHEMLMAMKESLSAGDLVLDVGANIGNHTLFLAGVVGSSVIAYEPDSRLVEALLRSVEYNDLTSLVTVRPVAVANEQGTLMLVDDVEGNMGAQHLTRSTNTAGTEVTVVFLDDEIPQQRVAAIKIDVEGYESQVIDGATNLIERDRPDLWVECLNEEEFSQVYSRLADLGYRPDGVFNASPTIRFVFDPIPSGRSLNRVVERLTSRFYGEHQSFLCTRTALLKANAKYRQMSQKNSELRDELISRGERVVVPASDRETVLEPLDYTPAMVEAINELLGEDDEVTAEDIHCTIDSVLDGVQAGSDIGVETGTPKLGPPDSNSSVNRITQQHAQGRALAQCASLLHSELLQSHSVTESLRREKRESELALTKVSSEAEALRARHLCFREDFKILREYVTDTETRLAGFSALTESNSAEIEALETALGTSQTQQQEFEDRVVALDRQLNDVEEDNLVLKGQQLKDRESIRALMRARDWFRQEADKVSNRHQRMETKFNDLEAHSDNLSEELKKVRSDRETALELLHEGREQLLRLRTSRTYRAGQAWRSIHTWKGFWVLVPTLVSIALEDRKTK